MPESRQPYANNPVVVWKGSGQSSPTIKADPHSEITHLKIKGEDGTENTYHFWRKHTPARLAQDILQHNRKYIFTSVLCNGIPGAGKTTGTQSIVHPIHEKDDSYNIHYYGPDDFINLEETLNALPRYQNCILIFDDVSFVLEILGEKEVLKRAHQLTIVREKLDPEHKQTKCICFMDFHYSFAIPKPIRQALFSIQFSITNEEKENNLKIMGYSNRKRILRFIRKYISSIVYDSFTMPAPISWPHGKTFTYPAKYFRPALVSNITRLHYLIFHEVKCGKCDPFKHRQKQYDPIDAVRMAQVVSEKGFDRAYRNVCYYVHQHTGKRDVLSRRDTYILRHIDDMCKERKIDLVQLFMLFKDTKRQSKETRMDYLLERLKELEKNNLEAQSALTDALAKINAEELKGEESDIEIDDEDAGIPDDDDESKFDPFDPTSVFRMR